MNSWVDGWIALNIQHHDVKEILCDDNTIVDFKIMFMCFRKVVFHQFKRRESGLVWSALKNGLGQCVNSPV